MRSIHYLVSVAARFHSSFRWGHLRRISIPGKFDLMQPARIGSTVPDPGHYTAEWSGSNDALNISIVSRGKTVATGTGSSQRNAEQVTVRCGLDILWPRPCTANRRD